MSDIKLQVLKWLIEKLEKYDVHELAHGSVYQTRVLFRDCIKIMVENIAKEGGLDERGES